MSELSFQVAQVNIARALPPMDADQMAGFVAALESINALADAAPGFVWRPQDDSGDATSIRVFDDELMLIKHVSVGIGRRARRFHVPQRAHRRDARAQAVVRNDAALPDALVGSLRTPANPGEARDRLEHLRRHGPTAATQILPNQGDYFLSGP
jgi:hypothetical protein